MHNKLDLKIISFFYLFLYNILIIIVNNICLVPKEGALPFFFGIYKSYLLPFYFLFGYIDSCLK